MNNLSIVYPGVVPKGVKTETFTGTIDNPFGENTPIEKIGEILNALHNGNALITLNVEIISMNIALNLTCYAGATLPNMYGNIYGVVNTNRLMAHFFWIINNNKFSITDKIVLQLNQINHTFVDVSDTITFGEIITVVKIWADD